MDIKAGWDFTKESDRKKAWEIIAKERPLLIIGSELCTALSTLKHMNEAKWRGSEERERRSDNAWRQAAQHANFCVKLYRHQIKSGLFFLHEQPLSARSWDLASVQRLINIKGIMQVRVDMCMFGMITYDEAGRPTSVRTPTGCLTNAWGIADAIGKRCDRGHKHQALPAGCAR